MSYYLSEEDLDDRLTELDVKLNPDDNCGASSWIGFACGGCSACLTAQAVFYFQEEKRAARNAHAMGLEYADQSVLPWYEITKGAVSHDAWQHMIAGEKSG